jgi:hypothetical protein
MDICSYSRPFDDQSQMKIRLETEAKLYIQSAVKGNKYLLVWSYMLDFENSVNPYGESKNAISPWKNIAHEYCSSSDEILSLGKKIMELGVKEKDSLHIACAIISGCDYFITTDRKLLNKHLVDMKVINPIDFILKTEDITNEN